MTEHEEQLRAALMRCHSRLSLLRHRGGIPWGLGLGTEWECDEVLGQAAIALKATEPKPHACVPDADGETCHVRRHSGTDGWCECRCHTDENRRLAEAEAPVGGETGKPSE